MPDRATTQVVAKPPAPRLIAVPGTGEALDLDAATHDDLAEVFDTAQQAESALRGFRRLIGDELLARMDHDASYTHRSQHWEVKGEGPRGYAYDGKTLWIALSRLVLRHAISADAARAAVRIDEVYTPRRRGVSALLKLGGEVAEAVEGCQVPDERPRRVQVQPLPDSPRYR